MDIEAIVVDDPQRGLFRVHRTSMTSPALFEQEQELIFKRCWIYVGHESEIAEPGDYRRRTVAGRPLLFVRGRDRGIRVFLNSCPHRGAQICRAEAGNADVLRCPYHAWTFDTQGELIGVPQADAYSASFDRATLGLKAPPRVASHRGFHFVCFSSEVEDLPRYLGAAKDYLDLVADQAEQGMRVVSGSNRYEIKANWKLLMENSLDAYHLLSTHRSYVDYISAIGSDDSKRTIATRPPGIARALGNGHTVAENVPVNGRPIAHWHPAFGEEARLPMARVRERLVQQHGEERAHRIANTSRNLLIYPNLLILDFVAVAIRYVEPLAPDRMAVTAWHLVPKEESGAALARRLDSYLTFLGPGGFATPDDVEILESCQAGFGATELEWSDISRGMHNPHPGTTDEIQMRGFWRQWHAHMQGLDETDGQDAPTSRREALDSRRSHCQPMRNTDSPGLRAQVEDFLFKEAALLDKWRLNEWVALFAEDGRYVVPTTDLPDGDPARDLVFIDDDLPRLRARADRLLGPHAHRERPRSRTRRFVSNVRAEELENGVVCAVANVLVYRFRAGDGAPYVGAIHYRLRSDGGDFKIAHRRAVLDMETLAWHGAVSIIF